MKLLFSFIVCSLCLLTFGNSQDWATFGGDSLSFSIECPSSLIEKKTQAMTDMGTIEVVSYGLVPKSKDPNKIYQVILFNYPKGSVPKDSIDLQNSIISELVIQSADEKNSELIYNEELYVYSKKVTQWRIHNNDNISIKSRAFFQNDTLYILQVMTDIEKSLNDDIDRFMNSFILKE